MKEKRSWIVTTKQDIVIGLITNKQQCRLIGAPIRMHSLLCQDLQWRSNSLSHSLLLTRRLSRLPQRRMHQPAHRQTLLRSRVAHRSSSLISIISSRRRRLRSREVMDTTASCLQLWADRCMLDIMAGLHRCRRQRRCLRSASLRLMIS